jgi:hypothetical protein
VLFYGTIIDVRVFALVSSLEGPAMNAWECNLRAAECAAKAAIAPAESISLEFLSLAARWRALAVRENFLGRLSGPGLPED